jgi:ribosomal RNA-processing protein 12
LIKVATKEAGIVISSPIYPIMEAPDFPTALANIRRLTASKLAHQAKPAQLLTAVEATLATALPNEQGPPFSPTAYFASLVGCLSKACAPGNKDADDFSDGGLVPAALYLLAAVAPETPRQVIVNQQQALVPLLVALFDKSLAHPPALRSLITIVTVVLTATPAAGLNGSPLLKRAWNHMLELNLDSRPKVRHLAQEGVRRTLSTPVPPKLIAGDHPYLPRARDWVASVLNEEAKGGASQAQAKKVKFAGVKGAVMQGSEDMEGKRAIWVIQGLRGWVNVWGEEVS